MVRGIVYEAYEEGLSVEEFLEMFGDDNKETLLKECVKLEFDYLIYGYNMN